MKYILRNILFRLNSFAKASFLVLLASNLSKMQITIIKLVFVSFL